MQKVLLQVLISYVEVNLGNEMKLEGNVVVIGGGNVAIDVARTATRVGASKVDMFCLESQRRNASS